MMPKEAHQKGNYAYRAVGEMKVMILSLFFSRFQVSIRGATGMSVRLILMLWCGLIM